MIFSLYWLTLLWLFLTTGRKKYCIFFCNLSSSVIFFAITYWWDLHFVNCDWLLNSAIANFITFSKDQLEKFIDILCYWTTSFTGKFCNTLFLPIGEFVTFLQPTVKKNIFFCNWPTNFQFFLQSTHKFFIYVSVTN